MSQSNTSQAQVAETSTQETKTFILQVRAKTSRKYAPDDKIRIVLEGFPKGDYRQRPFPAGGNQAGRILCLDQGIHVGG